MANLNADLFSYIVRSDSGFAPNPSGGICTLACCKPKIRKIANMDSWILGTTKAPASGRVVFAMQVSRALTFDKYFGDPRYACKKPGPNNPLGDNIYRKGSFGRLEQIRNSSHDQSHVERDLSTNRVLISEDFYYFGREAPQLPEKFTPLLHTTQGHKRVGTSPHECALIFELISWLQEHFSPGVQGEPTEKEVLCWSLDQDKPHVCV